MNKQQYFWLAVTADEYELPLAVENTAAALARRLGISEDTVRVMEYRGKNGWNTAEKTKGTGEREKDL